MTINNKTLSTLQGLVTATSTTEGDFRTGMNDVLAQVNANQEALAINVNNPQVITTLTSGSTYTIPSNALAIYIRAAGGGQGGNKFTRTEQNDQVSYNSFGGGSGGNTTISNTALSLSITAKGGGQSGSSSGGTVKIRKGGEGGKGATEGTGVSFWFPFVLGNWHSDNGDLVSTYINSSSIAGQSLSYSIGAGGAPNTSYLNSTAGDTGYIELWIW